ncbi:tyrosine integrase [Ruegeria phage RpAliso]|nr:tyrosine integrase [Ruegeria phage RpAliso]
MLANHLQAVYRYLHRNEARRSDMATKHAATLSDQQFKVLLKRVTETAHRPLVDRAAFLLSFTAGLRVQEIAGLEWKRHILGPDGKNFRTETFNIPGSKGRIKRVQYPVLFVSSDIGKYGSERTLRMAPMLVEALTALMDEGGMSHKWVLPSGRNGSSQDLKRRAHALAMRLNRTYDRMGFENCSSHSGRRTFITNSARSANLVGCSLADVQSMAGHKQLTTTQMYIDVTPNQADLIGMLYK